MGPASRRRSPRAARRVAQPAWWLPAGGWISPVALVRHWLSAPGLNLQCGQSVHRLEGSGNSGAWTALDAAGRPLAQADVVVVANAHDAQGLQAPWTDCTDWALSRSRGQITQLPAALCERAGWPLAQRPLASGGYLIGLPESLGGGLLCGATQQVSDELAGLRTDDPRHNLAQVQGLTGLSMTLSEDELAALPGRVGWRLTADDRLPVMGPVPRRDRRDARQQEQPRRVPRVDGLYVFTALGSRGLTVAPLLGEVLAAWITGAPLPLATSLLDALDVGRFAARQVRQAL